MGLFFILMTIILHISCHSIETLDSDVSREPTYFGNETQQIISKISLQWLNETTIKIIWPDQQEEAIGLKVPKLFPNLKDACIFDGSPKNENSTIFSAAIIGCMDSEETVINIGVNNEVLELTLLNNGTTLQNVWISMQPTKTKSPVEEQLSIINEDSSTKCACSNKTIESTDGRIFGKCNHPYKDMFFCYVDKRLQPECCEKESRFLDDYCLSYSLCSEANAPQPVPLIASQ